MSVVHAWNDATNAHDAPKLGSLYADRVELYAQSMSREKAMSIKSAAFPRHVHDDVSNIVVVTDRRAMFRKRSKATDGHVTDVTGYIDVDASMKIMAEGDTTTDAKLSRGREGACDEALWALINANPQTKPTTGASLEHYGPVWVVHYYVLRHPEEEEGELVVSDHLEIDLLGGEARYDDEPVSVDMGQMLALHCDSLGNTP